METFTDMEGLSFTVVALDLKLAKFHVEVADEVFKDVATLCHELGRLLIRQHLLDVLLGPLEVREEKNENFP